MPVNKKDDLEPQAGTATTPAEIDANQKSIAEMAKLEPVQVADPTKVPTDPTQIVVHDGNEAASTPSAAAGAHGMAHATAAGEVAGGNISKVLEAPISDTAVAHPLSKERAALLSPVARAIAGYIQRPVSEWGVLGPGDTIKGHMLLVDLNNGAKVRAMDGHKLGPGELYANLRNFPEALSTGDTIEQLLQGH